MKGKTTNGRNLLQPTPKSITQAINISSKIWIVLSDWPSVWGWKAILNCTLVPIASWNFTQNRDVNCGPLSDTIEIDTLYNHTISLINNSANWHEMGWFCQPVNNHPYRIITLLTPWQSCHKVHCDPFPHPFWNQQWLQQSKRFIVFTLYLLTCQTKSANKSNLTWKWAIIAPASLRSNLTPSSTYSCISLIRGLRTSWIWAKLPDDFLLKASATTFALPGWYYMVQS